MKTKTALLLALMLPACLGIYSREGELMPALSLLWSTEIAVQVKDAINHDALPPGVTAEQAAASSKAMQDALDSGDRERVAAVDWVTLKAVALAGVDAAVAAGTVDPDNAPSLRESVNQFEKKRLILLNR